jgi:hypothetical protein
MLRAARAVVFAALVPVLAGTGTAEGELVPGTLRDDVRDGTAALDALYRAQAACVGVARPQPPPRLEIRPGAKIRCPGVTPNGLCSGLHTRRPRRIVVTYATTYAIPHELLHDLLCQLPRAANPYGCDPDHESPLWQRCLP